ncbi:MAG: ABC transporter permease, partial [Dehalococcoidia bacterium]
MKELFGIPMDTIMIALVVMLGIALASVLWIAVTNRMMFKMGLRNLPRRGMQTGLVVVGLMLATLITTAAFTTGDTVDFSISKTGYESLQRSDLALNFVGEDVVTHGDVAVYVNEGATAGLEREFQNDPDIAGFLPFLQEPVPAINQRTGLSEPNITLSGIDPARLGNLGGLRLVDGGQANLSALGANDILLSERAADKLDARTGDTITVYANGQSAIVTVVGIVKDEAAVNGAAAFYEKGSGGGAMLLSSVQRLTGHDGQINLLTAALVGGVRDSYSRSDSAISRLEPFVQSDAGQQLFGLNKPITVDPIKQDAIEEAEANG